MKNKKIISKIIILSMFLMIVSSGLAIAEPVYGWEDSQFGDFYSGYNMVNTEWRTKTDDTSAYIYNSGSPCGVYVKIYGGNYRLCRCDGCMQNNITSHEDCSYYPNFVLVGQGQSKKLLNWVNERNYSVCALGMTGTQLRVYLSGLWSPDSI